MDSAALFKIQYGLFLISTQENGRDNACIGNVLAQVSSSPLRVALSSSKRNLTCETIERTGRFNVSTLTVEAPFSLYERFGFQSGRDVDKFAGLETVRSANGLVYEPRFANAYLSCKVVESLDLGSHRLFVAEVEDAAVLSKVESATYEYYRSEVKPKPAPVAKSVKGWRCSVCGYVHDVSIELNIHLAFAFCGLRVARLLVDGFAQKLDEHIIPDRLKMSVLLCADEVARAADFHVTHGNAEARAEFRVFSDGIESSSCNFAELLVLAEGQISAGSSC